jgi:hypothetical protein
LPTQTTQLQKKKNDILGYNFWLLFPNVMKFSAHEKYSSSPLFL